MPFETELTLPNPTEVLPRMLCPVYCMYRKECVKRKKNKKKSIITVSTEQIYTKLVLSNKNFASVLDLKETLQEVCQLLDH